MESMEGVMRRLVEGFHECGGVLSNHSTDRQALLPEGLFCLTLFMQDGSFAFAAGAFPSGPRAPSRVITKQLRRRSIRRQDSSKR